MKLENQVCTLEQSKKLKELGICQKSFLYYINGTTTPGTLSSKEKIIFNLHWSAFTVAELGIMFGKGTNSAALLYDAVQDQMNRSHSFTIALSPHFLGNCLIGLLETGRITIEEINQRLQSA
jgi:hypothetical protein